MKKETVKINTQYIQLNQLLKLAGIISTGGSAAYFIDENDIYYNSEYETRLRKKIYPGDILRINDEFEIEVLS